MKNKRKQTWKIIQLILSICLVGFFLFLGVDSLEGPKNPDPRNLWGLNEVMPKLIFRASIIFGITSLLWLIFTVRYFYQNELTDK